MKKLTFADMKEGDIFTVKCVKLNSGLCKPPSGSKAESWVIGITTEIHEVLESPPQIGNYFVSKDYPFIEYEYRGEFEGMSVLRRAPLSVIFKHIQPSELLSKYNKIEKSKS